MRWAPAPGAWRIFTGGGATERAPSTACTNRVEGAPIAAVGAEREHIARETEATAASRDMQGARRVMHQRRQEPREKRGFAPTETTGAEEPEDGRARRGS